VGPGARLGVGQDLAEVIPVVVDPLVKQIADPKEADLRMSPAALEVGRAEAGYEGDALAAQAGQLVQERRAPSSSRPTSAGGRGLGSGVIGP
jgi:hypothetical protein